MARFAATFTITEATDFEAGDYLRFDKFRDQFGQNVEFFAQSHAHSGDAGDGAAIAPADPKLTWMYGPSPGSPFA